ncbi:MAG: hypothetical protein ACJAUH_003121 [Saprospiraceae bacterium]|jgi:hypothetical protein
MALQLHSRESAILPSAEPLCVTITIGVANTVKAITVA